MEPPESSREDIKVQTGRHCTHCVLSLDGVFPLSSQEKPSSCRAGKGPILAPSGKASYPWGAHGWWTYSFYNIHLNVSSCLLRCFLDRNHLTAMFAPQPPAQGPGDGGPSRRITKRWLESTRAADLAVCLPPRGPLTAPVHCSLMCSQVGPVLLQAPRLSEAVPEPKTRPPSPCHSLLMPEEASIYLQCAPSVHWLVLILTVTSLAQPPHLLPVLLKQCFSSPHVHFHLSHTPSHSAPNLEMKFVNLNVRSQSEKRTRRWFEIKWNY